VAIWLNRALFVLDNPKPDSDLGSSPPLSNTPIKPTPISLSIAWECREGCFALPTLQPPDCGVFRFPTMQGRCFPAAPFPENHAVGVLNFFFVHVPPLQAAFWQSRSEPVKVLHCVSPARRRLRRPVTEPSPPLPCRKSHEAGALKQRNLG
jgi:hypothetical protein